MGDVGAADWRGSPRISFLANIGVGGANLRPSPILERRFRARLRTMVLPGDSLLDPFLGPLELTPKSFAESSCWKVASPCILEVTTGDLGEIQNRSPIADAKVMDAEACCEEGVPDNARRTRPICMKAGRLTRRRRFVLGATCHAAGRSPTPWRSRPGQEAAQGNRRSWPQRLGRMSRRGPQRRPRSMRPSHATAEEECPHRGGSRGRRGADSSSSVEVRSARIVYSLVVFACGFRWKTVACVM